MGVYLVLGKQYSIPIANVNDGANSELMLEHMCKTCEGEHSAYSLACRCQLSVHVLSNVSSNNCYTAMWLADGIGGLACRHALQLCAHVGSIYLTLKDVCACQVQGRAGRPAALYRY